MTYCDSSAKSYEELRVAALSGDLHCAPGSSVLLNRGVFGWMQLVSEISPQLGNAPVAQAPAGAPVVPGDVAHQLVQALATMLFDRRIGGVIYGR